ncbi:hypothetical protein V6N13_063670 [Hibiscus sabdariffa]|uniref:Uncharacterized protein n=1 Tax=Hibiscus sabdariffa TaxID=183260 RepID=A0ABR2R0Y1_9ROSI
MGETRPVPRRDSPWGMPEGDHRQPKAHRCNDRAEDVIQACFEGNPFKTVPGPFKLFWQCMRSKPGEEPTEPYTYLQLDPPKREIIFLAYLDFLLGVVDWWLGGLRIPSPQCELVMNGFRESTIREGSDTPFHSI